MCGGAAVAGALRGVGFGGLDQADERADYAHDELAGRGEFRGGGDLEILQIIEQCAAFSSLPAGDAVESRLFPGRVLAGSFREVQLYGERAADQLVDSLAVAAWHRAQQREHVLPQLPREPINVEPIMVQSHAESCWFPRAKPIAEPPSRMRRPASFPPEPEPAPEPAPAPTPPPCTCTCTAVPDHKREDGGQVSPAAVP
jgi:hypothetical protein